MFHQLLYCQSMLFFFVYNNNLWLFNVKTLGVIRVIFSQHLLNRRIKNQTFTLRNPIVPLVIHLFSITNSALLMDSGPRRDRVSAWDKTSRDSWNWKKTIRALIKTYRFFLIRQQTSTERRKSLIFAETQTLDAWIWLKSELNENNQASFHQNWWIIWTN